MSRARAGMCTCAAGIIFAVGAVLVPAASLDARSAQPCPDGIIRSVSIDNQPMFDADDPDLDGRVRWAYRAANSLHFETRERVIRAELLFAPGDCYDLFLLSESERLLRAFDVFATVEITGRPRADGTWDIEVVTRDEWSTRVDVRMRVDNGVEFEGARVFETNLLGLGRTFGAFYHEREVTRDFGLLYATPHFARTRWDFAVAAGRTRAGTLLNEEIGYPFVGEPGRWAGRQAFGREDQFFNYIMRDARELDSPHVLLPVRQKFLDLSVLRRFGERGRVFVLGGSLSFEELTFPGVVEVAPEGSFDDRVEADEATRMLIARHVNPVNAVRMSLLVGRRDVTWYTRRGLDSMRGEQDLRLGTEIGLVAGRSIPAFHEDDDWRFTLTTYAGVEATGGLLVARARGDARYDLDDDAAWQDLTADAELLAYWRRARLPRHTLVLRAAGAGAWSSATPYQLTLGGERAVRGYDHERFPGGRRFTVSLEDRIFLGWPFPDLFDSGLTLFADVGRIWPGDVPYGRDSGWRAAAGFGLRTSFPAGGRTTYRLDLAWPLESDTRFGDLRLRVTIGEVLGLSTRITDLQLARSRAEGAGGSLFDFRSR